MEGQDFVEAVRAYVAKMEARSPVFYHVEAAMYCALKNCLVQWDHEARIEQTMELGHS